MSDTEEILDALARIGNPPWIVTVKLDEESYQKMKTELEKYRTSHVLVLDSSQHVRTYEGSL